MEETIDIPLPDADTLAPPEVLDPIIARLRDARAVQVVGHVRPDGDCIGSMLAVHHLLVQWGIAHALAAAKIMANGYSGLAGYELIKEEIDPELKPDLTVCVDTANANRGPAGWKPEGDLINIDHHGTNTRYGTLNWIEPRCSSVGEMIYFLLMRAEARITPEVANVLFTALMTDTGSFRYSNTGPMQLLIAARLVVAGAKPQEVATMAYGSVSAKSARVIGAVYSSITIEANGKIAWSEIRRETYVSIGGEDQAPEDLSDVVRQILGVQVSLLFHELVEGGIRVSFRSNGPANVAVLAGEWGGGGHAAAAGLTILEGNYESLRDQILRRTIELYG